MLHLRNRREARVRSLRGVIGTALALVLLLASFGHAMAALTGTINGTVTDTQTHAPLANVKVTAVSPSGHATTTTNAQGFFSITGVDPDTYTVSFELPGYESSTLTGVTVNAEQIQTVAQALGKSLRTIGRVTSRSAGSAYQPNQTTDTYTITNSQIITSQGRDNNNNEVTLVGSIPGAEVDSSGYPSLRGGRENEIGFEYEGINYTEPYSNQFANSLLLNGVGSLQVSPGSGDASQGNSGTGVINLIAKRGTYPGFGMFSGEVAPQTFWHDAIAEYGFATPNGRFSNYFKYIGQRQAELYGDHNNNLAEIGEYDGNSFNTVNDFVDNMVYKLGKQQTKSLQFFYEGQVVQYAVGAAIPQDGSALYRVGDPTTDNRLAQIFGLGFLPWTGAEVANLRYLYPGQTTPGETLNGRLPSYNQPLQAFKLQFNDNPNASTYYNLRFYRVSAVTTFDFPQTIPAPAGTNDYQILQGGLRSGAGLDFNKQLNSKNLLSAGARYDFDTPVFSDQESRAGMYDLMGFSELNGGSPVFSGGQGSEIFDFIPGAPSSSSGPSSSSPCPGTPLGIKCGYLSQYFPQGIPRVPPQDLYEPYTRQEYGLYAKDDIQFNSRLKASLGLRLDGSNLQFGNLQQQFGIPNGSSNALRPLVLQPRVGASYEVTRNDNVSASFGNSIQDPYFSSMVNTINPAFFSQFSKVPAYDNFTGNQGPAVKFCGVNHNLSCTSYADQLYWEYQNAVGLPVFPVKPEQFTNVDFSYAHQFHNNIAVKVTPFYRNGSDIVVSTNPIISQNNGVPVLGPTSTTNDGKETTTGVEFQLTKDAEYGFSGQLTATYINEFSNIPPLASAEDVFPSISPASLALGKMYRVGFLSPFVSQLSLQYKTHNGFRINPVIQYTRGYPYNQGALTAFQLPNGQFTTVPNTNLTAPNGSALAPCYVDPGNPGSYTNPHLVACRGTAESPDPGGILSNARFNTDLTIEYQPPRSKITLGFQALGLFNNIYGYPQYNDCYQPVANGVSGPSSGGPTPNTCGSSNYSYGNGYNGRTNIRGTSPYLIIPNNNFGFTASSTQTPLLTLFYMQVKL